ncbi:carbohydrate esterase family 16 protein [Tylopilus felleus]
MGFTFLASAILVLVTPSISLGVVPGQIKNFFTFGDSYTDSLYYPSADGGYQWSTWAAEYGPFNLYGEFARSGATCSNFLTYRPLSSHYGVADSGILERDLRWYSDSQEPMYTIWIGTNDLGVNTLLMASDAPGVSIVPVRQCAIDVLKRLYESGARNFIMQNIIPLDLTILYTYDSYPNKYWTAQRNTTEWNVFMRELITQLELQALAPTLPGAHIASFDSYGLFADIYNHPGNYLNGIAPLNVTGCVNSCVYTLNESTSATVNCTVAQGSTQDSFMCCIFSQQTAGVLAREMVTVMSGQFSAWATWLS